MGSRTRIDSRGYEQRKICETLEHLSDLQLFLSVSPKEGNKVWGGIKMMSGSSSGFGYRGMDIRPQLLDTIIP
jgi:hypothetical protein